MLLVDIYVKMKVVVKETHNDSAMLIIPIIQSYKSERTQQISAKLQSIWSLLVPSSVLFQ